MANNQNPMLGQPMRPPMGAGTNLGLPNQFFQGPGGWGTGVPQGPGSLPQGPGQQPQMAPAAMQNWMAQIGGPKDPNAPQRDWSNMPGVTTGLGTPGSQLPANYQPLMRPAAGAPGQGAGGWAQGGPGPGMQDLLTGAGGGPPKGAPGQGAGGGKAQGMAPGMQQQIARLPGAPPPGAAPQAPPALLGPAKPKMGRGRPALGAGGQKAPGMQRQIAQLPGGPR
jgi:hypothetical protein